MTRPFQTETLHILALEGQPTDIDLSHDGTRLAVSGGTNGVGWIQVYDTRDGREISTYGTTSRRGLGVVFGASADELFFVTESRHVSYELWHTSGSAPSPTLVAEYSTPVRALISDPYARYLIVASADTLYTLSLHSNDLIFDFVSGSPGSCQVKICKRPARGQECSKGDQIRPLFGLVKAQ